MELVEGRTLYAALKEGPLPLKDLLPIALQATEALGEAHRAGILYRGIQAGKHRRHPARAGQGSRLRTRQAHRRLARGKRRRIHRRPADRGRSDLRDPFLHVARAASFHAAGRSKRPLLPRNRPLRDGDGTAAVRRHLEDRDGRRDPARRAAHPPRPADSGASEAHHSEVLQKEPEKRYATTEALHKDLAALQESLGPRLHGLSRGAWIGGGSNPRPCLRRRLVLAKILPREVGARTATRDHEALRGRRLPEGCRTHHESPHDPPEERRSREALDQGHRRGHDRNGSGRSRRLGKAVQVRRNVVEELGHDATEEDPDSSGLLRLENLEDGIRDSLVHRQ